jgi:hypothetical protein
MRRASAGLLGAMLALSSGPGHAAESPASRRPGRDPFAMPAAFRAAPASVAGPAAAAAEPTWAPRLRGVMVAGRRSMADVEGVMVMLGDSVDGWRLIKVGEREAVFLRKGKEVTLPLAARKEPDR